MKNGQKADGKTVIAKVIDIFLWIFLAFATVITVIAISTTTNGDKTPNIGGYSLMTVESDSMKPVFEAGDLIIIRQLSDEEKNDLEVGDIIMYLDDIGENDALLFNTHRIVSVEKDSDGNLIRVTTKGDNYEYNYGNEDEPTSASDIRGIYTGTHIGGIGTVLEFLRSSTGFLVCIVIPLLIFLIYEIVVVVKYIIALKNKDKKIITAEDEELIKQRAIEEFLRQQQASQAGSAVEEAKEAESAEAPANGDNTENTENSENN